MSRNPDKTSSDDGPVELKDKNSDLRLFNPRGQEDKSYASYEGDRYVSELDSDCITDDRTDLNKLSWATNIQRGLIDNRWW